MGERKSIVANLASLIASRQEDRKKRKLKPDDNITEVIKAVAFGIADGRY